MKERLGERGIEGKSDGGEEGRCRKLRLRLRKKRVKGNG